MADTRPTVLVVDDDGANLRTFKRVFRRDFLVLTAASGEDAIETLRNAHVDVAFVDYSMPRMDGLSLLKLLHNLHPQLVCYLLTGYGDLPEIAEHRDMGLFAGVLSKPWERPAIQEAVASTVRR